MSQSTTWEINGVSFELDLTDADDLERYENALEKLREAEHNIKKDGKESELIRAFCKMLADFFDAVLGEGASAKIFEGKKTSVAVYLETYDNFLDFANTQKAGIKERFAKYNPNRQQRRVAAKKKK